LFSRVERVLNGSFLWFFRSVEELRITEAFLLLFSGVALKVRSPPCLAEKDCFKSVPGVS